MERVTATWQKDFVRIYISCDRLIEKRIVFEVEEQIKNQLFPGCNIAIKIQEKFHLSAQYDPPKLLEAYYDSILLELKECSPVEYSIFKNAQLSFLEGGRIRLEVPDTVIVHERCPELIRILEKICCERCGIPVEVFAEYTRTERAAAGRKMNGPSPAGWRRFPGKFPAGSRSAGRRNPKRSPGTRCVRFRGFRQRAGSAF